MRIEDLLSREVVRFDPASADLVSAYGGRRILVTGAGGSIGSELCQHLALLEPAALLMLDKDENGVFEVELTMRDLMPADRLVPIIQEFQKILVAPQRTIAPDAMTTALGRIREAVAAQNEASLMDAMESIGAGYRRAASWGSRV